MKKNFNQIIIDKSILMLHQVANKENKSFNKDLAYKYILDTRKEKVKQIFLSVRKDMEEADIMKGLDRKKPVLHSLVKQVMEVSLQHECLKYAQEILINSKI